MRSGAWSWPRRSCSIAAYEERFGHLQLGHILVRVQAVDDLRSVGRRGPYALSGTTYADAIELAERDRVLPARNQPRPRRPLARRMVLRLRAPERGRPWRRPAELFGVWP